MLGRAGRRLRDARNLWRGGLEAFGAGLVTTEKDWVRLPPAWREKVRAWPVKAVFDDEAGLDALLRQAL